MSSSPDLKDSFSQFQQAFQDLVVRVFRDIVTCLDTPKDLHLQGTAERIGKAYAQDYFSGLFHNPESVFQSGIFPGSSNEMILVKDIDFVSFCAHHFVPFIGHAHVAYIPQDKMVGLSKIPRVIDILARRPQIQERLTEQIADCLFKGLDPKGLGVVLEAEHYCMAIRGVKKSGITTKTTVLRGCFMDQTTKGEFLGAVRV